MLSATNSGQEMCMQMHTYKSEEHADEIHEGSGTSFTETGRTVSQENLQRGQPDNQVFNDPDEADKVVDGSEGHGMTDKDQEVLRSLIPLFVKALPVQQTLDRMSDVFDEEEVEEITLSSKTPHQQRRCLIYTLIKKGPEAFQRFVSVLDKVRPHLADALRDRKNGKQLDEVLEGLPSLEQ
ncbi:uncharacterized protein [Ptychodera flava]|uniref:uncharacterized protein n=1 Tax=Ptychodera flava TaxID=63121 RepID=UPI003969E9AC